MKKRAVSLLLVLSLLLALLSFGPLSTAEESAAPEEASEWIASEGIAEAPVAEEPVEEEPVEEEPVEEAPVAEAQAPVEGEGSEGAPAEGEQTEVEPPFSEEGGAGDAPVEAEPVEEAPEVVAPVEEELVEHPVFAPVEEDPVEEELANLDALRKVPALGSDNVRYEGVAYLSQAAFNSLSEDQQRNYVQMVDEVTDLLDDGIPVADVVFSLDAEGTLGFNCAIPMKTFSGGSWDARPEPEVAEEVEEAIEAVELPEDAAEPSEEPVEVESESPQPAAGEPIVENVELAERVRVPLVKIEGAGKRASGAAYISGTSLRSLDSLYTSEGDSFYNQLSAGAKAYYNAGKAGIVDQGNSGFRLEKTTYYSKETKFPYAGDAVSALILDYPEAFDWMAPGGSMRTKIWDYGSGIFTLEVTLDVSPYYSAELEQKARDKVRSLAREALEYAQSKYPYDIDYGIIYYLDEWICENNYYNMAGVSNDSAQIQTETYYYCHSSYGTLLKGYGVCESYALAMSRLLDAAGIPNLYAVGEADSGSGYGGHAWNYARMSDGKYYLLDTTWDDPIYVDGSSKGTTREFLLCEDDYKHKADGMKFTSPTVTYTSFNYPALSTARYVYKSSAPSATPRITAEPTHPIFATATPEPTATPTPTPEQSVTATPTPTATATPTPEESVTATPTPTATATPTPEPEESATATPTPTATATPTPEPEESGTPESTATPESTPEPELIASELYLAKGGASTLKILDSTYAAKKYKKTWTSSDKSVATVSSSGKVTAVKPGVATVTLKIDGKSKAKCSVRVYQFTGLYFENGKTSRSKTFISHGEMTEQMFHLSVKQKSKAMTAEALREKKGLKVSVSTSKSSVATASAALTGDEIALTVTPHGLGSATITVKFGDKTATLSFKVRRALEDEWFKMSINRLTYNGKAHKPSVLLTDDAPISIANHYYSVSYSKNKNAGTARVTITGSGNYTGSVTKTFEIMPKDLATAVNLTISKPASKTYTGAARSASLSVQLNKTALKLGSDYVIRYDGKATKPVDAGKYSVTIEGRGNYTGTPDIARSFTVKRASISNLKVTANDTVKYSGGPIALSKLKLRVKLGGNTLPASDYSVRYKASNGTISDDPPTARGTYKLIITPTGGNIATTSKKKTITKSFKVTK